MDETMNVGTEATTEVSEVDGMNQNIEINDCSDGPSKGFIALVVGGIAAVAVGAAVAIKRHKKKKAARAEEAVDYEDEEDHDEYCSDDEEDESLEAEVVEEKPAKKK